MRVLHGDDVSAVSYFINEAIAKAPLRHRQAKMNFEAAAHPPWCGSPPSSRSSSPPTLPVLPAHPRAGRQHKTLWWKLSYHHHLRHSGRRSHPRDDQDPSPRPTSGHVKRSGHGLARGWRQSLNVLSAAWWPATSRAYWTGHCHRRPHGRIAYAVSARRVWAPSWTARGSLRLWSRGLRLLGHGPGDHRRRFVRPGHGQRPVGVRTLAPSRAIPNVKEGDQEGLRLRPQLRRPPRSYLEENDGAGNTFKATAKPVLIGTAVVGATTMIFSIIQMLLTKIGLKPDLLSRGCPSCTHPVPAGSDLRRRCDLLVHRRVHPGRVHRRLPRGRVHQEEHQA